MSGQKTLEICCAAQRSGKYFLGCKGQIYGVAEFGEPLRIASTAEWAAMKSQHLDDTLELLYKRTLLSPSSE